jgi:hypothetical protein
MVFTINQVAIGGNLLKIKFPMIIAFIQYGTTHM